MIHLDLVLPTFIAGLLSFLNPCTAPLLPAYFACLSGAGAAPRRAGEADLRPRLVLASFLYVAGFATVFVLLGIAAGGIGHALLLVSRPLEIVGGIAMVLFGLVLLGALRWTPLLRERRVELPARLASGGVAAAYPIGVVFGIGWTPCVGPYLATALSIAAISGSALSGALLLLAYALGLGSPFVIAALLWASLPGLPRAISRLAGPATRVGGVFTVGLGLLLLSGAYVHLTSYLASLSTPH